MPLTFKRTGLAVLALSAITIAPASAHDVETDAIIVPMTAPEPAFTYQSMMNIYFDDESGLISIRDIDLAFAPEGEINAGVALVDSTNTVIASHTFYPDPRWREGVFARLSEVGPADFTLTEPGTYSLVYLIDGKPVSRLPFGLEQTSEGDDPFNPVKTYRFYGMWGVYGYLTMNTWKDAPFPELNLWLGGRDLAEGETKDMFVATLKHGDDVIAHSKETLGFFSQGHYKPTKISLFHPHTRREIPNAEPFMLSDWTRADGEYRLEITRTSDGALIRSFVINVKDGKVQNLPSTALTMEPHIDYITPRVTIKGANMYGFVEAIWVKSEPAKKSGEEAHEER
ncbi:MAG: hypothetical protein H6815_09345 [Phycisphaeraceae bacterium]|nr:hypothetical protein [Phycisphaerales bacterium]MCB9860642.1 hypothetical protein [Phycisphaeraceae bacterium]